jgi:predicted ATP-binding protein involved in virulence
LFREDASLLECIQWLKDLYLRRLEEKPGAKELEEGTLRLLDDGMLPDGMKVDRVDSDGLWVRQAGMALPLRDLSDGYRTMVALVLDILRHMHTSYGSLPVKQTPQQTSYIDLPGVVLIDEIDVHLHVSWQQRIGFWLKRRFPRVQFIVASHSPFVCQAADPGGLIRLPAPGERRTAEKVSADLHKRIVRGTADDAALSELFGLESTRSAETTELMQELAELEARITKGTASPSDKRRFRALQIEIPFTPTGSVELALEAIQEAVKIQ